MEEPHAPPVRCKSIQAIAWEGMPVDDVGGGGMDLPEKRSAHRSGSVRALAVATAFLACAALFARCGPAGSNLALHNRTDVPVWFSNWRGDAQYVPACSSETFYWDGAWSAKAPVEPIADALEIEIRTDVAPHAESTGQFVLLVTADRINLVDTADSLPPCSGVPPTSLFLKVDNLTSVPVWFESGGEAHYIEACGWSRYQWSDDAWTNKTESKAAIPNAVEVSVDVTPPPAKRVDTTFVIVTSDGTKVIESDGGYPPRSCTPAASG
jgi:hypothetical protein